MALDRQTLVNKLRASGAFTESEIESEADTMMKDDRAAERRDTLNSTKVAAEPVATTQPAPAASVAPPAASVVSPATSSLSVPTVPAGTTAADVFTGKTVPSGMGTPPEQRVGQVGQTVATAGGNFVQDSLDYARNAIANNPELTGALAAIPLAYGANKLGLFDTLGSKMSASAAQPQPFVGGSGPRNTPPAPPAPPASPIQNWDIHGDPSFGNFLGDATAPAATTAPATPAAAPSRNLTLEEAQARMAGVTPAAAPVTPEAAPAKAAWAPPTAEIINKPSMLPSGSTIGTTPARPVTPTPAAALPTGEPVTPVLSQRVQDAIRNVPKSVQDQYAKEGKVVLKDFGVGDRSITNTYGIPAYQKIIDYFNEGKPIGDDANYQIIRKKINQGVPASLAAEFAAKLPGSEAEAGNFGKAFGETGAYTKEGKIVTSPAAMKKAVAGGGALFLATAFPNIVNAAQRGDKGPLLETAFDVGVGAIPVVGTAAQAMMGTNVGAPTVRSEPFAEVLQRPGVRQVLQNMSQTMSPSEFNVARDQYLSKLSSFPEYNSLRFTKPAIGSTQPINRTTLLPIAPPAR